MRWIESQCGNASSEEEQDCAEVGNFVPSWGGVEV